MKLFLRVIIRSMSRPSPEPFKLHAGHPALELVNTLDLRFSANAVELIPAYSDLLRLTAQLRLLTADQARKLTRTIDAKDAQRVLASTVELREALAAVLYGRIDGGKPPAAQVETLEKYFHAAALHRRLRAGNSHLDLELVRRGAASGDSTVEAGPGGFGFAGLE